MNTVMIFLIAWVVLGLVTAIILTIWDYNDGETITIEDILIAISCGSLFGPIVFIYMLGQLSSRSNLFSGFKKFLKKPIWQKTPKEK